MASRDTTLGYFSVKQPFENGHDCHRFVTHEEKAQAKAKAGKKHKARKSESKDAAPSEQDE